MRPSGPRGTLMKMTKSILGSTAAVLAVVLPAVAAQRTPASAAAAACAREAMPVLPGSTGRGVGGGDPGGRYQFGASQGADDESHNILWRDGTARELRIPTA